jgi:hypothetical protein
MTIRHSFEIDLRTILFTSNTTSVMDVKTFSIENRSTKLKVKFFEMNEAASIQLVAEGDGSVINVILEMKKMREL